MMGHWGILKGQWNTIEHGYVTLGHCDRTGSHSDSAMDNYTISATGQPCDGPMENCHGTAKFCGRILLHHCGIEESCIFIVACCANHKGR